MGSKVKELKGNKVQISFTVAPEVFEDGLQKAYQKTRGKFTVHGFRKGKAPRKVIETYYGEGVFYEDAFDIIFLDIYDEAIKEHSLDVVSRPENIDIQKIGKQDGLEFTVDVYVKPVVTVENYKGVEIEKEEVKVGAKEVNAELERVQRQNVRWIEVDREAKSGDTVVMDYSGSVNGKKFDGGTAEGQSLELGSNTFIPGFEDQIVGMKAGEQKDITVTFPKEYPVPELAGKEAVFAINLISVKEKEVPAIDDEFAADVSEFDTLAEYKKDIKKNLTKKAETLAKDKAEDQLIRKIVEGTEIDVPAAMIDSQTDYHLQQLAYQLMYQGMRIDDYLKMTGKTMDDLRADYKDQSELQVKTRLCIEAMIKQENIQADQKAVDALIADAAEQSGKPVEDFAKTLSEEDKKYFEDRAKVDSLFDMLMKEAKITVVEAKKEKKPAAKKAAPNKDTKKKDAEQKTE